VAVLVVAGIAGEYGAPLDYLPWAVAAGLIGFSSLCAFYAALASGTMGVVAPIAAMGVVVPVVVGLARGDRPSAVTLAGIVVAIAGAILASGPELTGGARPRPLLLAALAAIGFGIVLTLIAKGGETSPLMTLVGMRATATVIVIALAARSRSVGGLQRGDLPLLALIGLGDVGANWAFAQATRSGYLSVVSVLGSLYPAVTVLLARVIDGERMRRIQDIGVAAALVGVVLIAAG
jgi:drug/metabolite transporter (DMT)-like permease